MTTDAAEPPAADRSDSPLVDRWIALDRGWQALALGLGIVVVHVAGQTAAAFL
ncbi:hypothetical protein [Halorubrum trueperi]|uniref:Uncharacterized protein n=1 Tax=Halorubrum trueperi TaxID=2004704 RepID=A0ABD5UF00_9EURY